MKLNKEIILLIGASGTGKTTFLQVLKSMGIPELISHTTRDIRIKNGEVEGVTYYYKTLETFDFDEMVEFTEYPKHSGKYYGTSKIEIENKLNQSDKVCIICDRHGAEEFKKLYGNLVKIIYIYTPIQNMIQHMRDRGDNEENIMERLINAVNTREMENIDIADFVIVNKDLDKSIELLKKIIEL